MADLELSTGVDNFLQTGKVFKRTYLPGDVIVFCGDSNTNGRPGWSGDTDVTQTGLTEDPVPAGSDGAAVGYEWLGPGGIFEGCTILNRAFNGTEIAGWVASISSDDNTTDVTKRGSAWAVVNNDPDLIIVSLGTNELFLAERRASEGVEATMQANYDTLIQFFLDNSTADIWLRIPQPFAYPGEVTELGDWADADACAASSEQLRRVHLNCSNINNPRVFLFDSHKHLFGYRCDDKATDCLDEETGDPMISDELHCTDLGYRRIAQRMADQLRGGRHKPFGTLAASPLEAVENAIWSETVYLAAVTVLGSGSSLANFTLDPMANLDGYYAQRRTQNGTLPEASMAYLPAMRALSRFGAVQRVLAAGSAGGEAKVFCYCHASGNIYSMSKLNLSQYVTATVPYYAECIASNHQNYAADTSADWSSSDVGAVTFWVESKDYMTTGYVSNSTKTIIPIKLREDINAAIAGNTRAIWEAPCAITGATFRSYAATPPSGGTLAMSVYSAAQGAALSGSVIATLNHADGVQYVTYGSGAINIAAGDQLTFYVDSNAGGAKGIIFNLYGSAVIP